MYSTWRYSEQYLEGEGTTETPGRLAAVGTWMAAFRLLEVSPKNTARLWNKKHSTLLAQSLVLLEGVLAVVVPATLAAPVDRGSGVKAYAMARQGWSPLPALKRVPPVDFHLLEADVPAPAPAKPWLQLNQPPTRPKQQGRAGAALHGVVNVAQGGAELLVALGTLKNGTFGSSRRWWRRWWWHERS